MDVVKVISLKIKEFNNKVHVKCERKKGVIGDLNDSSLRKENKRAVIYKDNKLQKEKI